MREKRALRVAIVGQFFAPEPLAAANRIGVMAAKYAEAGADVTVLTGMPSFPSGTIAPPYRGRRWVVESAGPVRVERVWTYASPRPAAGSRILNWLSVAAGVSLRLVFRTGRFDVVVVSSPPITVAIPAFVGALRHRARIIVDIRDVWPEIAVRLGRWRSDGVLTRIVGTVADAMYRLASLVVCVTEGQRAEIEARGVPAVKLVVAPNGYDRVTASTEPVAVRQAGETLVGFVGNFGFSAGLDVVLDAARILGPSYRFVIVGGGMEAERIAKRVEDEALTQVTLMGVLPRERALRLLEDAHLCVIPLRSGIEDTLPTKMFDAMAMACPIVLSASGEARRLLEASASGIAVEPENAQALADGIRTLASDPAAAVACGENGRRYVREHYDRERILGRLAERVLALCAERKPLGRSSEIAQP